MKHSHIPETKIVDWMLGTLPEQEKEAVSSHLRQCASCQNALKAWEAIGMKATSRPGEPPSAMKEQIWAKAEAQKRAKRVQHRFRWASGLAGAALVAFLFFFRSSFSGDERVVPHEPSNDHYRYVVVEAPPERIVHHPETKRFPIEPLAHFEQLNGTIWLNDDTKEMVMEVEGLKPFAARDYQLWIVYTDNEMKGELLTIRHGTSRILITGEDVKRFKQIKASLEPKGGSVTPTGPETFIVDLKHK
ncbi:anti-sigma factor [Geobacillus sp. 46C-IIa]|uniref:anti-sigma factor n=1 Tax=Geobacillus sp. 46C-IIa TaxID=1963025 RepID=UPI0009BE15A6|nr:anti-sigma factor [Geobacillus sp. 46C-IIa]OQP07006.1 anti-sigma factor [Geobacillus sp. 46C-IIa]QNU27271.1 anti-sigma factor [Geobacillus sp. 46C-IIa]